MNTTTKRHGVGDPGRQWVTCTLGDLVVLLTGARPQPAQPKGGAE